MTAIAKREEGAVRTMVEITRAARERRALAFRLRSEGKKLREIAPILGVGISYASTIVRAGACQEQRRAARAERNS